MVTARCSSLSSMKPASPSIVLGTGLGSPLLLGPSSSRRHVCLLQSYRTINFIETRTGEHSAEITSSPSLQYGGGGGPAVSSALLQRDLTGKNEQFS